jgi:hypothetical protein
MTGVVQKGRTSPMTADSAGSQAQQLVGEAQETAVGQGRLSLIGRRIRYMGRFVYWTVRHRSTANVRWVLAYEGYSW